MNTENFLHAVRLHIESKVPRWYSLAPLEQSVGLQLTLHETTWQGILALCGSFIDPHTFKAGSVHNEWLTIKFPYSAQHCQTLQRTLAYVLDAINSVQEKPADPHEFQLSACDILRSVPELKGYLMEAYISYELKQLLQGEERDQATQLATRAMRKAAKVLKSHVRAESFQTAIREEGFIYFALSDGSGTCFGTDYRDLEPLEIPTGYRLSSDNIDSPGIQLIFLSAFAAVTEWGRRQLLSESQRA